MRTRNESKIAKSVLFVCVENACRSQMAEGFLEHFGKERIEAYSAGSRPADQVNPLAIKAMRERGIDVSRQRPKGFDELPQFEFNYIITMGCKDACPSIPAKARIEWDISDPKGKSLETFREVRDEIGGRVEELVRVIFQDS